MTSVPFGLRLDGIGWSFKQEHCRLAGLCMVGANLSLLSSGLRLQIISTIAVLRSAAGLLARLGFELMGPFGAPQRLKLAFLEFQTVDLLVGWSFLLMYQVILSNRQMWSI